MKRQVISGLLALTTLTGCGGSSNSKEETSQPTELVYTDPQEIQDRFIVNEGTGFVYVDNALEKDPNTELASSLRNNNFEITFSDTARSLEGITNIYVTDFPSLTRDNSFTVNSLRAMSDTSNLYTNPTRVWIDEGHYVGDGFPIILFNPTQIEGVSKNTTSIGGAILAVDYLGVKDLTIYGETVDFFGDEESAGIVFNSKGELYDLNITELGVIGVDADSQFTMSNVFFYDINNPQFPAAFHFQGSNNNTREINSDTKISYTTFQNLPIAFNIRRSIDASNIDNIDGGNNTFRDVGIVIYHSSDNTEDSFAEGNYWAESLE